MNNTFSFQITLALCSILVTTSVFAEQAIPKKAAAPFQSSENFEYVAEKTDPLIGLIKSDTFQGVILRQDSTMESLRLIDDHLVPTTGKAKIDEKSCREAINRILGPDQGEDPAIKISKVEIFKGRRGEACEVQAEDVKTVPAPKRYSVIVGVHKGKVRAFVARDKSSGPRPDESGEFRSFFHSIK